MATLSKRRARHTNKNRICRHDASSPFVDSPPDSPPIISRRFSKASGLASLVRRHEGGIEEIIDILRFCLNASMTLPISAMSIPSSTKFIFEAVSSSVTTDRLVRRSIEAKATVHGNKSRYEALESGTFQSLIDHRPLGLSRRFIPVRTIAFDDLRPTSIGRRAQYAARMPTTGCAKVHGNVREACFRACRLEIEGKENPISRVFSEKNPEPPSPVLLGALDPPSTSPRIAL